MKIIVLTDKSTFIEFICNAWWCSSCHLRFRCLTEKPLVLTEKEIRDNSKYNGYIATALQLWMVKNE